MTLTTNSVPKELEKQLRTVIEMEKELEQYKKNVKSELIKAMKEHDIVSIKNDIYSITLATRTNYSGDLTFISDEFKKPALDSRKISAYVKLNNSLPTNITVNETEYLTWRLK